MTDLFKSPLINKTDLFQSHKVKRSGLATYTNTISKKAAYNKLISKGNNIEKLIADRTAVMNILTRNKDKPRYRANYPMRYSQLEAEVYALRERAHQIAQDKEELQKFITANSGNMVPADVVSQVIGGKKPKIKWVDVKPPLVSPKQVPETESITVPELSTQPIYIPTGGEAKGTIASVSSGQPPFQQSTTGIEAEQETGDEDWVDVSSPETSSPETSEREPTEPEPSESESEKLKVPKATDPNFKNFRLVYNPDDPENPKGIYVNPEKQKRPRKRATKQIPYEPISSESDISESENGNISENLTETTRGRRQSRKKELEQIKVRAPTSEDEIVSYGTKQPETLEQRIARIEEEMKMSSGQLSENTARRRTERLGELGKVKGDINVKNLKRTEKKITS